MITLDHSTKQLTRSDTDMPRMAEDPPTSDTGVGNEESFPEKTISSLDATDSDYKKNDRIVSSTAPTLSQIEAYKNVDKALFNAYLRRLQALILDVSAQNEVDANLTLMIKISEAYTVSIRTEKVYRLFISAVLLIVRNNYEALKGPRHSQQFSAALKKYADGKRQVRDYDFFMKACYLAGLSSLNRR